MSRKDTYSVATIRDRGTRAKQRKRGPRRVRLGALTHKQWFRLLDVLEDPDHLGAWL